MSRVTLSDVWHTLTEAPATDFDKVSQLEIVPRKMVEMIIEKCSKDICAEHGSNFAKAEASLIKRYAESLLKQFEEDD